MQPHSMYIVYCIGYIGLLIATNKLSTQIHNDDN